jgi:hypothetical protein
VAVAVDSCVRRLDQSFLADGVGLSLLAVEREAFAVGDFRVLIPPAPWIPPTPDSVEYRHLGHSVGRPGGDSKLAWASVPE